MDRTKPCFICFVLGVRQKLMKMENIWEELMLGDTVIISVTKKVQFFSSVNLLVSKIFIFNGLQDSATEKANSLFSSLN
jgi:hypothetical protein